MCVAFELEANIMAKMTREQQEKLCDIYNASDIEALDYMYDGRISRNHKKNSENLHRYRSKKVSAGKRTIRKQRYPIQPHDIVVCDEKKYKTSGCHCNGTRAILLPSRRSVSVKKLKIHHFSGGYFEKQRIAQ